MTFSQILVQLKNGVGSKSLSVNKLFRLLSAFPTEKNVSYGNAVDSSIPPVHLTRTRLNVRYTDGSVASR